MFVHTVQAGESLFEISKRYRIPVNQIQTVNGLTETNIVPGQALLIDSYTYVVQPGDTYSLIAHKAFVPIGQLEAANSMIKPETLQPGMIIKIPDTSNYIADTLSYYGVRSPELDQALIREYAPYSSSISIFEYHFASNGDIVNQLEDYAAIETTWKNRVTPLVTITNLTEAGFDSELVHLVLNNPAARSNLVDHIAELVLRKGYGGVNIDFELVRAVDRDLFSGFLRQLRDRLKPGGFALTIAVPPKTSEDIPWMLGYDYGAIGSVVDSMFIMAYDWHHSVSEAGPVAPLDQVKNTIQFALKYVPRQKIILGVPLYGYSWSIPYQPGMVAPGISNQNAIQTAMRYQAPIQYSREAQTPYYQYRNEQGMLHEVWFEDVRSMSGKMLLVREYGLQALGAWQLTLGFAPGTWLLRKFFTIRKL
ncbi:glycoside hydrolase family 18 protein [Paenibacillus hexagrammi]|uniref:Glycoside hydrolase family 18 protein n=1 Tax=Paenibacillus hexagrammi TaxID=2908839 RepID=A0ABY3SM43_9BACL|nr:glycoside hydrolase family 18 protein [Paenibacillus sp. YPD9-1]UJF34485.1 glycoside hydrolase family 18 protein [Paenibacillus sp. YPD9-1]